MTCTLVKVIIVSGGSSGIGRAIALVFADRGAKVIITARGAVALNQTAADHPNVVGLVANAAAPDDAVHTVAEAIDRWGRLDVLANNAGAGAMLSLADATADQITKTFAVNVPEPGLLAAAALPHLAVTKGTIINVSSTFGHRSAAGFFHYAASTSTVAVFIGLWILNTVAV
jgi:NAD(P)-dependent dehydrogenase (short-subunit alcohol dehydrogenase family)